MTIEGIYMPLTLTEKLLSILLISCMIAMLGAALYLKDDSTVKDSFSKNGDKNEPTTNR